MVNNKEYMDDLNKPGGTRKESRAGLDDDTPGLLPTVLPPGTIKLTPAQVEIYHYKRPHPGVSLHSNTFFIRYRQVLDKSLLEKAINKVIQGNDGLRLRIAKSDREAGPFMYIIDFEKISLKELDFTGAHSESQLHQWIKKVGQKPMTFFDSDLFYFTYIKLNEQKSGYYVKLHHIIADIWSCYLFFKEIDRVYNFLKTGKDIEGLESRPIPYLEYAAGEHRYLLSENFQADKQFWHNIMLPVPDPIDFKMIGTANTGNMSANHLLVLPFPGSLLTRVNEYRKTSGIDLHKFVLFTFFMYVYRVTTAEDIVIAIFDRNPAVKNSPGIIGMCANIIPFRVKVNGDMTFHHFSMKERERLDNMMDNHAGYPFHRLVSEILEETGTRVGHLSDMAVSTPVLIGKEPYITEHLSSGKPGGSPGLHIYIHYNHGLQDGPVELEYVYAADRFNETDIKRIHQCLVNLQVDILEHPDKKISEIELLSQTEKEQVLYKFNDTAVDYPKEKTIHQLFEEQVDQIPDKIAAVGPGSDLFITYRQLEEKANPLAHFLAEEQAVGPDTLVGILMEPSLDLITAVIGILKAGGAYLPLDPGMPRDRIKIIIDDSNLRVMISQKHFIKILNNLQRECRQFDAYLCMDSENIYGEGEAEETESEPNNLAYVIYTSGSTGKPKGVMVAHCSLVNLCFWHNTYYCVTSQDRATKYAGLGFDASVWEIFPYLVIGASIYIVPEEIMLDIEALNDYYEANGITISFLPTQVCERFMEVNNTSLRVLLTGGDKIKKYINRNYLLYNNYGPTENTVVTTSFRVTELSGNIPIGKPLFNNRIYIMDRNRRLQPIGVPGELCIAGGSLALGYLNRPGLTSEKFIDYNLPTKNEAQQLTPITDTIYKTGDLARWLPDGNIEFLGRIDYQVKIRGFRIELGEIENQLLDIENINESVVVAQRDEKGENYLCAFFVAHGKIDISSLKNKLSQSLPGYMVPSYFLQIEKLPLTPNGKLDRKALPYPRLLEKKENYVAPRDNIEEKLVEIWGELLQMNKNNIGIDDNFFSSGGHSLKAAVMMTQIHKLFNVKVLIHHIFDMPTIRKLAEYIKKAKKDIYTTIPSVEKKEYYPQTSTQKRMYFFNQLKKNSILYNIQMMDVYCKGIARESLEQAIRLLIKRHESLRSSFFTVNGEAVMRVHDFVAVGLNFEIEYWETAEDGMIYSDQEGKEWTRITGLPFNDVVEHFVRPFDLSKAPLLRVGLIRIWGKTQILLVDMHHIMSDGVSAVIFMKDLWTLYDGEELPGLKAQYKDFAQWLNSEAQQKETKKQEPFWIKEFGGDIPVLNLPQDYPRPAKLTFDGDAFYFELDKEETTKLNLLARQQGVTLYMVLFAVYNILLSKLSGQEEIIIGTATAGRGHADLQKIIGMFVNTLAVRNFVYREQIFKEFLSAVKRKVLAAFENQDYPFEELVSKISFRADVSRNPIFDVVFTMDTEAEKFEEYLHDVLMLDKSNPYNIKQAKMDLVLFAAEKGEELHFNLEYNVNLFKEETIERFIMYYKKIISSISSDIQMKISEIDIIPDLERGILLYGFNDTEAEYPKDRTFHQLFEEEVPRQPDKLALVGEALALEPKAQGNVNTITYNQLNAKANQLARVLRNKGLKPEEITALMVEPSIEMIIGMLAVLKAGGAFLPIDHKIPKDRVKYMVEESVVELFLTRSELLETVDFKGEIIEIDDIGIYRGDDNNLGFVNQPDRLAYVIFTSGSTGKPKGVLCEHRPLINLCYWYHQYFSTTPDDRVAKYASLGFDASVWEIFPHLVIGSSIYIVPEKIKLDITALNNYFEENGITISFLPTQLSEQFMNIDNSSLRILQAAGDKLKYFVKKNYKLYNCYGPTENTVNATDFLVTELTDNISIGSPMANNQIYILDRDFHLLPIGVPGELCIGGDSVTRGYMNNPGLTAEKFVRNPYPLPPPLMLFFRLYRTGDLARWQPDGNIEFLGRIDYQVKIRGFRIELGEIENQLLRIDGIKEAVVIDKDDNFGHKYLCAYIVSAKSMDVKSLRSRLAKELPDYMIPTHFMQLEEIPLNPNGKIDRKRLPAPEIKGAAYIAPGNEIERILADEWSAVLGIEKIGIDDNFFNNGGDSIKTILISARLRKHDLDAHVNDFFSYPTIRQLAKNIKKIERVIPQEPVSGKVQLTPILAWFFEKDFEEKHHFNHFVLWHSKEELEEKMVKQVFTKIVEHHDALRMVFDLNEKTHQVIPRNRGLKEGSLFDMETFNWVNKKENQVEIQIEHHVNRINREIDILTGPLVKLALFRTRAGDRLLVVIHHAVIDGISWRILVEDFTSGFQQAKKGKPIKFQDKSDSFQYWASQLNRHADTPAMLKELDYWKTLEETKIEKIPRDHHVGKEAQIYKNLDTVLMKLNKEDTEKLLKEVNFAYNTEINDILLTALAITINLRCVNKKILINLEGHGREGIIRDMDISRTIGWFTSQYPVLLDMNPLSCETLSPTEELAERIKQVKETLRRIPNKGIGYGILRYLTSPAKKDNVTFKLQPEISFNYLGQVLESSEEPGKKFHSHFEASFSPAFDTGCAFDIYGSAGKDGLNLMFNYNRYEYDQLTAQEFADGYKKNLLKIIEHCVEKKKEILKLGLSAVEYHIKKDYDKYRERIKREEWPDLTVKNAYKHLLLTGSTGFLGAHLVPELLDNTNAVLYLPVRGATQAEAEARFKKKMAFYHQQDFFNFYKDRLAVLKADLGEERLGIDKHRYEILCDTVEAVIHPAANVKLHGLYEDFFKDNVLATGHLLEFAEANKKKDFHYISTLAVGDGNIPGRDYILFTEYCNDIDMKFDHVYIKSKYEAEKRVIAYRKRGINGCIYRVGNLIFHSGTGKFQENISDDYFYNIIKGAIKLEMLSEQMKKMVFDMSFIDYTAKAVALLLSRKELENETYHVVNPYKLPMLELAQFLEEVGFRLNEVEEGQEKDYLTRFEGHREYERIIELLKLHSRGLVEKKGTQTVYKMDRTEILYNKLGLEWPKTTKELIEKMINYCKEVGFL